MAYYKISEERLTGIANQARRLGNVEGPLSAQQMQTVLEQVELEGGGAGPTVPPNVINYAYEMSTGSTDHSRTYTGKAGSRLLLLVLTRGELTTELSGWTKIGALVESGDKDAGSVAYVQYVTAFTKVCMGEEFVSYTQAVSNMSITCIIEFEGVSGFEMLESTRMENVIASTGDPDFTCSRSSTRMAIWITDVIYFLNTTAWKVSGASIWAISDNHGTIQPRLGVFIDRRPAPIDFTLDAGMSGDKDNTRYASCICIQTIPSGKALASTSLPAKVVYWNDMNGNVFSKLDQLPKVLSSSAVETFDVSDTWGWSAVSNLVPGDVPHIVAFENDVADSAYRVSNQLQGGNWPGITIGGWFKRTKVINTYGRIFSFSGNAGLKSIYSVPNSTKLCCDGNNVNNFYDAPVGQWNHIAMSLTPASTSGKFVQDIIINGTILATGEIDMASVDFSNVAVSNLTYYFAGDMKNLFLSKGALTLEEVRQMMLRD